MFRLVMLFVIFNFYIQNISMFFLKDKKKNGLNQNPPLQLQIAPCSCHTLLLSNIRHEGSRPSVKYFFKEVIFFLILEIFSDFQTFFSECFCVFEDFLLLYFLWIFWIFILFLDFIDFLKLQGYYLK